jgi:hypothetical protein
VRCTPSVAMAPKGTGPAHRPAVTTWEYAVFCYLRLHPEVAETYGINEVDGATSLGSMLLQTLQAQGMSVAFHDDLPDDAIPDDASANVKAAAYIDTVGRRPGRWLQQLKDRPIVLPGPDAAVRIRDHRTRPPLRVSFSLLVKLSKHRRNRRFTSCGNLIGAPSDVALVDRRVMVRGIERLCRCSCGAQLRFCQAQSHQAAACAVWVFVCTNSCEPIQLRTSKPMHGNDYELNTKLNFAVVTCALSFERISDALKVLGMRPPSTTDHYHFKAVNTISHSANPNPNPNPNPTLTLTLTLALALP